MRRNAEAEDLGPYLSYSVAFHLLAAAAFLKVLQGLPSPASPVYTIDFVGPAATIAAAGPVMSPKSETASIAPLRPAQQVQFDEFGRRLRKGRFVLPRPSLLRGYSEKAPAQEAQPAPAASNAVEASGAAGEAGLATDMPNFPYPWYISQVRAALWNQWAARMPKQGGECMLVFTLLPDGKVVDLRTEVSSGDANFDLIALGVVQDASPYPPLPRGFREPFLKIHLTLKSQ